MHSIQVKAFPAEDASGVATLKERLSSEGWRAVITRQTSGSQLTGVCVGKYETQADARWARQALRQNGYEGAFCVSFDNSAKETPVPLACAKSAVFRSAGALQEAQTTSALQKYIAGIGADDRSQLMKLLSEQPESNTANASQSLSLMSGLKPFAEAQSPATRLEACQARLAIANACHYGEEKQWLKAYVAYGEALDLATSGSREEAECLLQRAALVSELVGTGIGSWEEARRSCRQALERVSPANERVHVVATLMHAEALFDEKKYEKALGEFLALQRKWPGRWREFLAAQAYAGVCCMKLKRYAEAEAYFHGVIIADAGAEHSFQWRGKVRDLTVDAAEWLSMACLGQGKTEESKLWRRYAKQRAQDPKAPLPAELEAAK